jgi:hypothetical protein
VIKGKPELVLGRHEARGAMADGHAGILPTTTGRARSGPPPRNRPAVRLLGGRWHLAWTEDTSIVESRIESSDSGCARRVGVRSPYPSTEEL